MQYVKFISRKILQDNPDTLFVFGDNMMEQGLGGQAKEMRGEPNAVGIPTKFLPSYEPQAFFSDDDFYRVKTKIDAQVLKLFVHASGGGDIVWPEDGIGTGLADLKNKAPIIFSLIETYRLALERLT
jgi:hypothetical protein